MANVTIVPTQVQTVAASGQQTQSSQTPSLPAGSNVSGTISGKDANGNFLLRTATQGTLTLRSSTPLTYNSDVVVHIDTANANATTARIISVNGEPFASFAAPEAEASDSVSQTLLTTSQPQSTEPTAPATTAQPTAAPTQTAAPTANTSIPIPPTIIRALVVSAPTSQQQLAASTTPEQTAATNNPSSSNTPPITAGTSIAIRVDQAPQTTTQQAITTPNTPAVTESTGNATASSGVQAQAQAQALADAQTPATVASAAGAQQDVLQQNRPNAPITQQAQTVEQEPAQTNNAAPEQTAAQAASSSSPTPQQQAAPSPQYAVYAKQSAAVPQAAASTSPTPSQPATAAPSKPPPNTANSVSAQVINTSENGLVSLQTAAGVVTVKADALTQLPLLSPGTNVTVELPPTPLSIILTPTGLSSAPAALTELAGTWQSLSDILSIVSASNPTVASTLLSQLPQLGTDFIASSASFISALTQGNVRKILGDDTVDTLKQNGHDDLIEKFTSEANSLSQAFTQPADRQTAAWQPLFLPFVYQEEVQQARMYVKRDAPKKDRTSGTKATGDTRFVVEVDMSELGPMQFDGLVRAKDPQSTSFDLMIRTHTALSKEDRDAIAGIYTEASQITGFKGSLAFQVTPDFPVKPLEETLAGSARSITV